MKKIAIIGHFGGDRTFLDGQTVKTRILYDELERLTGWKILKVDTFNRRTNPIKLILEAVTALVSTRDIIVLLSRNGIKLFFPFLNFASRVFGTRVYHDVIGGYIGNLVRERPDLRRYMNSFKVNWVETERIRKELEACGVGNCEVIPNFKRLSILSESEIPAEEDTLFRFCTFSRVTKEKGIEDAVNAIEEINAEEGRIVCTLDIYGMVDDEYRKRFEDVLTRTTDRVKYMGTVEYGRSVETIKDYSALLFPTYYEGEGFPGTIVDAFSASLVVIASDWNSNSELIEDGKTGLLYSPDEKDGLKSAIRRFISLSSEERREIRRNSLKKAEEYMPDKWIEKIRDRVDGR